MQSFVAVFVDHWSRIDLFRSIARHLLTLFQTFASMAKTFFWRGYLCLNRIFGFSCFSFDFLVRLCSCARVKNCRLGWWLLLPNGIHISGIAIHFFCLFAVYLLFANPNRCRYSLPFSMNFICFHINNNGSHFLLHLHISIVLPFSI